MCVRGTLLHAGILINGLSTHTLLAVHAQHTSLNTTVFSVSTYPMVAAHVACHTHTRAHTVTRHNRVDSSSPLLRTSRRGLTG